MKRAIKTLLFLTFAVCCLGQEDLSKVLSFETDHTAGRPGGWMGGPPGTLFVDKKVVHSGSWAARLERTSDSAERFSTITRSIPIDFTGTRIELRGWLKAENVSGMVGLWLREDGKTGPVAFDNMASRQLKGTLDWAKHSVSIPFRAEAKALFYGFLVSGTGKAWADDLELLVDGKPIWDAPKVERPRAPLGFPSFQDKIGILPEGVFATNDPSSLPLPTSGYQVYLVGEAHGNQETKALFLSYLSQLYSKSKLRDVVLEEDQVYEEEARAFVQDRRNDLPPGLCLRANILGGLREFNRSLPVDKQIRVHLIDIDSPGQAIHQHLSQLKDRIGTSARSLEIPGEEELSAKGIDTANGLAALTTDTAILGGLRTIRQSLIAYKDGFRVHIGPIEGNAAHPAREEAITANLLDVLRTAQPGSVLGLYGSIHVRRGSLNLPDPAKGGTFHHFPMAGRLEKTGVEVYKLCSEPLSGPLFWRLNYFEFPSDRAEQFRLNGGETLGDILQKAPDFEFIHFDFAKGIRLSTESEDYSEQFDACVFFRKITPMENLCSPPSK